MSHENSPVLDDNVARVGHEVLEPLTEETTTEDEISNIGDSSASSIKIPKSLTASEECHSVEQPKTVMSKRRKDALFRSLIHIPATFVTLGTLSLTFRGVFWQAPTSYTNTVLNVLQFVAKIHETLIIFSLTAIIMHRVRYEVIGRNGIPLGLLSAALQYSSLQILTRKDLRQGLGSPKQFRRYLGLILLVILASFLALISGPSTAIAILPRLEWWPVKPSHNTTSPAYPPIIYYNTSAFPNVVTFPQVPCYSNKIEDLCGYVNQCLSNTTNIHWCPSSGLNTILESELVQTWLQYNSLLSAVPILVSSPENNEISIFSRSLNGNLLNDTTGNTAFISSVVPDITAMALEYFWRNLDQKHDLARPMTKTFSVKNRINGLLKPLVQVQCAGSNNTLTDSTSDMVTFPSNFRNPETTSNASWTVPLIGLLTNTGTEDPSEQIRYKWVNLSMPENVSPSAAAVVLMPGGVGDFYYPPTNTYACTIDAMWIPSECWADPTIDNVIHESTNDPLQERNNFKKESRKIQLSQSWLDILNPWLDSEEHSTSLQQIAKFCTDYAYARASRQQANLCFEVVLASYIADGLARIEARTDRYYSWQGTVFQGSLKRQEQFFDNGVILDKGVKSWLNAYNDTMPQFTIEILQYGYGYGFQGGKAIYFATIILLIYVIVAFIHMAVLITGGWSSDSWNKPGELIALAVNSPPTELLRNTCAGIEDPIMWTRVVSIRETEDRHLGIVFEEEGKDGVVDREIEAENQSMETKGRQPELKESQSGVRRRVIPGKKYGTMTSQASPTIFTARVSASPQISDSCNLFDE